MIKHLLLATLVLLGAGLQAATFADQVGAVAVKPVKNKAMIETPFITWGGDVATFHANGGLKTAPGSLMAQQGLKLDLRAGDDFVAQVRRYLAGESPFLRGTMRMLGQASEVLGADPRTKPVVVLQLTWSAGDHAVARGGVKNLNQLKGKKVVLQSGGPHVGMLDDMLAAAGLGWNDITVVWASELTGPKGPAALFAKDASIDVCMVITPDMFGLTGGADSTGTGAEGTVKGAKVLLSTAQMSRSIADVYAVRKDFYDANKAMIEKFVAAYLKACEEVVEAKKAFEGGGKAPAYMAMLKRAQDIYGTEVLPTLEVDAHGLVADCAFVGHPGNVAFFTETGNLNGFAAKSKAATELAVRLGLASVEAGFFGPDYDFAQVAKLGALKHAGAVRSSKIAEDVTVFPDDDFDDRTIVSFTIQFKPNQTDFPASVYGPEFQRAVQAASTFGNAVIAITGHADPTKTLVDLIKGGMKAGTITRHGQKGAYSYSLNGKPIDLKATDTIRQLIEKGTFDNVDPNPRTTMQAALNLSLARAASVRDSVLAFAKTKGLVIDASQMQPVGMGIKTPVVAKPRNLAEASKNMRVEFRVVKVPAEAVQASDFDF